MSKENTLIGDHPGDTLDRCADIAAYVRQTFAQDDGGGADLDVHAAQGLLCIMEAVEGALRHEAERVGGRLVDGKIELKRSGAAS